VINDGLKSLRENRRKPRSLHYAPPDFLSSFLMLMKFLRLSNGEPHTRSSWGAR
jgi:hypothetical protein